MNRSGYVILTHVQRPASCKNMFFVVASLRLQKHYGSSRIVRGTAVLVHDIQLHPIETLDEHLSSMNRGGLVIL